MKSQQPVDITESCQQSPGIKTLVSSPTLCAEPHDMFFGQPEMLKISCPLVRSNWCMDLAASVRRSSSSTTIVDDFTFERCVDNTRSDDTDSSIQGSQYSFRIQTVAQKLEDVNESSERDGEVQGSLIKRMMERLVHHVIKSGLVARRVVVMNK